MAKILIVDDDPLCREALRAMLSGSENQLLEDDCGEAAIVTASRTQPDLVLLDVRLPDISGFEVLQRLKSDARQRFLPVILVTAYDDEGWREHGLSVGADEVVRKPFDPRELQLRIAHLLKLRHDQETLARRNLQLAELQRFREEMTTLLIHDLKNPLTSIVANTSFLLDGKVDEEERRDALADVRKASTRMLGLLANLLEMAKLEDARFRVERREVSLADVTEEILSSRRHHFARRRIQVQLRDLSLAAVHVDRDLMTRVLENVVDNALRYAPVGGRIVIALERHGDACQISIGNNGPPIPAEARARVFEKFGQVSSQIGRTNLGLGLYFCRLVVEAHGGRISVEERAELPTTFVIDLPDPPAASPEPRQRRETHESLDGRVSAGAS